MLEREYPPWAALHFKQPRRGVRILSCVISSLCSFSCQWPPPPRTTPIIVPTALLTPAPGDVVAPEPQEPIVPPQDIDGTSKSKGKSKVPGGVRRQKSSLHRAVMEKIQVRNALQDLQEAGEGSSGAL